MPNPARTRPASVRVDLSLETRDANPPLRGWLAGQLKHIIQLAGVKNARVHLMVVADRRMAAMHKRYLGVPDTTDVLTFDWAEGSDKKVEGEIVVCLDEAVRQARARGHDVRLEVLLYAVHGFLHLVGYDDHTPRQASRMHRREDRLLTSAELGPVYSRRVARRPPKKTGR